MEKHVRIISQGPLVENTWTPRDGQSKTIANVELHLKSGTDEFVAQVTGDLARTINSQPLDLNGLYEVHIKMFVSEGKTAGMKFNNLRVVDIQQL